MGFRYFVAWTMLIAFFDLRPTTIFVVSNFSFKMEIRFKSKKYVLTSDINMKK